MATCISTRRRMRVNSTRKLVRKLDAAQLRLPACQQVDDGLGRGATGAVPRPRESSTWRCASMPRTRWWAPARRSPHRKALREAFDGYLPDSILWRQKEQFSDGVGYGWIDGLKAHAEAQVSDRVLACRQALPAQPPQTKGRRTTTATCSSSSSRAGQRPRPCRGQVHRLFVARGHCLGRQLRRGCRSLGPRDRRVHEQALA